VAMYALTVDVVWLFPCQRKDKHISTRTVQTEKARNKGIKKDATVHSLRHSSATHLLSGVDLRYVQEMRQTTEIYTHVSTKNLVRLSIRRTCWEVRSIQNEHIRNAYMNELGDICLEEEIRDA